MDWAAAPCMCAWDNACIHDERQSAKRRERSAVIDCNCAKLFVFFCACGRVPGRGIAKVLGRARIFFVASFPTHDALLDHSRWSEVASFSIRQASRSQQ